MSWNLTLIEGPNDSYEVPPKTGPIVRFGIGETKNAIQIRADIENQFKSKKFVPDDEVTDLLNLSLLVYSADTRISRIRSTADRWTRDFVVHMPVSNLSRWQGASDLITRLLSFLTGDNWAIKFRKRIRPSAKGNKQGTIADDACLFSGGMDSFIGAIELLTKKKSIALVGHHGMGTNLKNQEDCYKMINSQFPGQSVPAWFYVQPDKPEGDGEFESSTRGRSFLFFALGVAVATGTKNRRLHVPENGLISLNAPLMFTRLGTLSTRTTHPFVLACYRQLLEKIGISVELITPYQFMTKGEMVSIVRKEKTFTQGHKLTISCAHPKASRYEKDPKKRKVGTHCGYCLPCIIRRAALFSNKMDSDDDYLYDVRSESIRRSPSRGVDRRAFDVALERLSGTSKLKAAAEILKGGPLPPKDVPLLTDTFIRGMDEVRIFLNKK